ncbi:MAG: Dam family site-specific DNA-(adenine-N6)-methyltransferase [Christensenellaceae bacterium]|jgi:adenine-specific DNA-methyltransferase|nr:Dam family site-specific DNA-(adenine-N6)-methyltransferase [Christensenellaceae bacterium]
MADVSTARMLSELKISRSTLSSLIKAHGIQVSLSDTGHYQWDDKSFSAIKSVMVEKQKTQRVPISKMKYKTMHINNRRYLGNKYKLLDFIKSIIASECAGINTVADIFAGTGAVASAFLDKKIITNDTLYFNYVCHIAWFSPQKYDCDKVFALIEQYNNTAVTEDNYVSRNFSNTYFSLDDCRKIGFIREDIEARYKSGNINFRERAILLMSLMCAMDKIANTCGHYDAYRQGAEFERCLELAVPQTAQNNNENNQCFNEDANELVKRIEADLVYIDPPYNSRQYCDTYHLLENIARWEQPEVFGTARKMDRTTLKSEYCTTAAPVAFERLIRLIKAKYILVSYNNMAEKGNTRSNAKISDDDIIRILSAKGRVKVFSETYKAFTTGRSDRKENEERLFLCECYDYGTKELMQSPLNYIGGKYKLLPQILPHFPKDINLFVDLFCGGGNVGINADCRRVIFNDNNNLLRHLFGAFKNVDKDVTFETIDRIVEEYGLSNSSKNGYGFYSCNSIDGLGSYNSERYLRLREDFNKKKSQDYDYYIMLYVLILYAFNNQIRFNSKGEFNLPVGKRDFNDKMREKLSAFIDRLKSVDYKFESVDFRKLDNAEWDDKTFVYCDPPYLITCATYNEQGGWNEDLERGLLAYLDGLNERGISFALSNILRSKGKENKILYDWLKANTAKYRVIYLDYSYANSNYQTKDRTASAEEILVVNY